MLPDGAEHLGDQRLPLFLRHSRRGGLLHQLLVVFLDRALPLPQTYRVARLIGQDLKLDMPGGVDEFFHVQLAAAEGGQALGAGRGKGVFHLLRAVDLPDPPAAAAGFGFEQHGIAQLLGQRQCLGRVGDRPGTGDHGHACLGHHALCLLLVAELIHNIRTGPDKDETVLFAQAGKGLVLRQKTVAGMDGLGSGGERRRHDPLGIEIAVGRGRLPDADGLIRHGGVQGVGIGLGLDRHRLDSHFPAGADHPHRHLTAVGDKNF